ncbi:MAG: ABC transporter permease [Rhodovulum sp.]|nr:ABC transporter permease [Rhodovulum sp.]|tara:strand:+ start:499 stop:1446 length:948 start_codon:yes stop_codon:yes gene_type:complete
MRNLILTRLALAIVTLFFVSVIVFAAVRFLPGDIAQQLLGQSATPENVAALRQQLGLDVPGYISYFDWLGGLFRGDLGQSIATGRSVSELISGRLANTLFLAGFTAIIAIPLGYIFGFLGALLKGTSFDRATNVIALSIISLPEYFVAYVLVVLLAVKTGWFPALSRVSPSMGFLDYAERLVLPSMSLGFVIIAYIMRVTKSSILNVLGEDYVQMAQMKGNSRFRVMFVHALPNALAPIINVTAINLAYLVVGVVIVETVFVYPGLGQLLVDSVAKRDMPVVQAVCLVFAGIYILVNATADILIVLSNPRLRHAK